MESKTRKVVDNAVSDAVRHLSEAIQIPTVSHADGHVDADAFLAFHDFLTQTYPLIHSVFTRETVAGHSLLYRYTGDPALKPILLMAHMDVVPAQEDADWQFPPFSGEIRDGYIHGRGALDMKGQLIAIFEALETLLTQGFAPRRGLYISLGHDEETRETGNKSISELLTRRGIQFEYVFDEGGSFLNAAHLGIQKPLALFGVCEKGYAELTLTARAPGAQAGHASTPPKNSPWVRLSRALLALERHPMKARLTPPIREMLNALAPHMSPLRRVMARLRPRYFLRLFEKEPFTNALARTTIAPTLGGGGQQANMLPRSVSVSLNIRVLSADTQNDVIHHLDHVCKDVEIDIACYQPPSNVSEGDHSRIRTLIEQVFPGYIAAPYIMTGSTDSKHFRALCNQVILISPFPCLIEDYPTIHAANERIAVSSLSAGVAFFTRLIQAFV